MAPAPRPEATDGAGSEDALRRLDQAVQAGDTARIRTALGAALASAQIADLRRFEARLRLALDELPGAHGTAPRGAAA